MLNMEAVWNEVISEIKEKTVEVLKELCDIWKHSYKQETIEKYSKRLTQHVTDLYNDILEEAESTRTVHIAELEELMHQVSEICKTLSEPLPVESFQDLPLHDANQVLKNKLAHFKSTLDERRVEIDSLLERETALCEELGRKHKSLPQSPLPSSKQMEAFQFYLENMESEILNRREDMQKIRDELARIFDELETKPSLESEAVVIGNTKIKVTDANMNLVRLIHAQYQDKLEMSKTTVLELREKLSHLWERLEEEPIIRNEFLRKHQGHGEKTAMALRKEIAKCEEKKRNNIRVFIEKMRNEILCLWDKCMISKEEREEFQAFKSDFYSEDLLTLHEMHVENLEEFYQSNQKIFDLLNKRSELWEKLTELETKSNDPNRYNNRGGKLLLEEKERKKIAAKLPKVEQELLLMSKEYRENTNKVFTVYGDTLEEMIQNKHIERKIDKQCQLSARKQARAVTPINVQASSTRTRLFSGTKSSANLLGTPASSTKRKRSPVYTPKTTTLKPFLENLDPGRSVEQSRSAKKNVLSLKKSNSAIKRRSGPRRSNPKLPKILKSSAKTALNASKSYDHFMKKTEKANTEMPLNATKTYANFKTHLQEHAHLRSSIAPSKKGATTSVTPKRPIVTLSSPTPPHPRLTRQNTFSGSTQKKTPRLTRSSSVLSPASISGRLTTRNLPIII